MPKHNSFPLSNEGLAKVAMPIAYHYGFRPLSEVTKRKLVAETEEEVKRRETGKAIAGLPTNTPSALDPFAEEAAKLFGTLQTRNHLPPTDPLFVFWHPGGSKASFALGVIGTPLSVAEALLIKTGHAIINEATRGTREINVQIGSQGDRESALRFGREALVSMRKFENELPKEVRILARDDAYSAARQIHEKHPSVASRLPSPMDFLSDKSRTHLREVLEHLEAADIPYAMRSSCIGHPDWHSETIFEVTVSNKDRIETSKTGTSNEFETVARGARYDEYGKRLAKQKTHGTLLFFLGKNIRKNAMPYPREKAPLAYFIHIGFEARLFGVALMETLRTSRIPIRHSFGTAGFREQLQKAELSKSPYALIMGHKEALERSVILRDMSTRAQESVLLANLPKRLTTLAEKRKR